MRKVTVPTRSAALRAKVREKDARIGVSAGRYRRLWFIELEPDRLNSDFRQTQWREPSNLDAIVVGGLG